MRFVIVFLVISSFWACGPSHSDIDSKSSSEERIIELPKYAKGFALVTQGNSRSVILYEPNQSGTIINEYSLPDTIVRIACLSTTHIPFFDKLKQLEHVAAVSFADQVRNANAADRIKSQHIQNLTQGGDDVNHEVLMASRPDLFLVYPHMETSLADFERMGIPCLPFMEYTEVHPLGRAEWIKVVAFLLNEDSLGRAVFSQIETAYNSAKAQASSFPNHPKVMTGSKEGDYWFIPSGKSFVGQFIEDAGGEYAYAHDTSGKNIQLDQEKMIVQLNEADWWGVVLHSETPVNIQKLRQDEPLLKHSKPFKEGHLFYTNTAVNDYFGDAVVEPHIVLQDLIHVFHGDLYRSEGRYFSVAIE